MTYTLVLLRHGQSTWNQENLFTGWTTSTSPTQGEAEAAEAGQAARRGRARVRRRPHLAADAGHPHAPTWPSTELGQLWLPVGGQLAAQRAPLRRPPGPRQEGDGRAVRRGAGRSCGGAATTCRRPPIDADDADHPRNDPRYARLPPDVLPATECLEGRRRADAALLVRRHRPRPARRADACSSPPTATACGRWSSTSTASSDDDIAELNIPTGIPRLYELGADLQIESVRYLGDASAVEAAAEAVRRRRAEAPRIKTAAKRAAGRGENRLPSGASRRRPSLRRPAPSQVGERSR